MISETWGVLGSNKSIDDVRSNTLSDNTLKLNANWFSGMLNL